MVLIIYDDLNFQTSDIGLEIKFYI